MTMVSDPRADLPDEAPVAAPKTLFLYSGFDQDGLPVQRAAVWARDQDDAARLIRQRGIIVDQIWVPGWLEKIGYRLHNARPVSHKDLTYMAESLATGLEVAIPIQNTLRMIARRSGKKRIAHIMNDVADQISRGIPVAQAFEDHREALGDMTVAMVVQAVVSGTGASTMRRLARIEQDRASLVSALRSALMYPAFVFTAFLIVIVVVLTTIVPIFKHMYHLVAPGHSLPAPTQATIGISSAILDHWYYFVLAIVVIVWALRAAYRNPETKQKLHRAWLSAPVFGPLLQVASSAQVASTLAVCLDSDLPFEKALRFAGQAAGNLAVQRQLQDAAAQVERGIPIAQALNGCTLLQEEIAQVAAILGGNQASMFERLGDTYQEDAQRKSKVLSQMLEPLMTIGLGLLIGALVVTLYLPIVQLPTLIGHG